MGKEWFEPELSRHLGPVHAPEELWDRIENPREPRAARPARVWKARLAWAAAAVVVIGGAWALSRNSEASLSNEALAVKALIRGPQYVEFRSEEAPQVRSWIKDGTGLEVPLPPKTSSSVQLIGAKVVRKGVPTAEISYRVRGVDATLVVSKMADGAGQKHTFLGTGSLKGTKYSTWTMRGQSYTVACADTKVACLLCHGAGGPAASSFN